MRETQEPEPGWYTARRSDWDSTQALTVVRLSQNEEGAVALVWKIGSRDPETLESWRLIEKVRMHGDVRSLEIDRLLADARERGREEERAGQFSGFFAEDTSSSKGRSLALRMSPDFAEDLSSGLSDLLCWARGFSAALSSDQSERNPMGIEWVRRVRETLSQAQRAAGKQSS